MYVEWYYEWSVRLHDSHGEKKSSSVFYPAYHQFRNGFASTNSKRCKFKINKMMPQIATWSRPTSTSTVHFRCLFSSKFIQSKVRSGCFPVEPTWLFHRMWLNGNGNSAWDMDSDIPAKSSVTEVSPPGLPGGVNCSEADMSCGASWWPSVRIDNAGGRGCKDSPTSTSSTSIKGSSTPSLWRPASITSNRSRCSSTVTPVIPGFRWKMYWSISLWRAMPHRWWEFTRATVAPRTSWEGHSTYRRSRRSTQWAHIRRIRHRIYNFNFVVPHKCSCAACQLERAFRLIRKSVDKPENQAVPSSWNRGKWHPS